MENPITTRGWTCARSADFADGYLLWMPPLLLSFNGPDLAAPLLAPLTVLLVGAVFWADGRGRAEGWAETLFAFGWMGAWAAASALLLLELDGGGDFGALGAALGLAAGAAALAGCWGWRRRRPARAGSERPALAGGGDAAVWLAAGTLLLVLLLFAGDAPLWPGAASLGLASVLYLLLAPRGRAAGTCGGWR